MSDTIQTLSDFVTAAERNRKYPTNTIYGIRAALRLFSQELTDQEKESIDIFKKHFEQIYQSVFNKNKVKINASSLETYKRRMWGLLNDYEKYGIDPTKMAEWDRPMRRRHTKKTKEASGVPENEFEAIDRPQTIITTPEIDRHELTLRPGVKAIILVPSDLKSDEVKRIKNLVDYLAKDIEPSQ